VVGYLQRGAREGNTGGGDERNKQCREGEKTEYRLNEKIKTKILYKHTVSILCWFFLCPDIIALLFIGNVLFL